MKAVILAAGTGTRLRPLTLDTPKPLLEISGKPIIEKILEALPDEIEEVIIVVKYLKEKIIARLGTNFVGKKIIYVEQGEKRGTYGALLSTKHLLNDKFLVLNGDDLHDRDELKQFMAITSRAFGLQKMQMPHYYSIEVENGYVKGFEKDKEEEKLVATGVYMLDSEIFKHPGVIVFGGEYGLPQTMLEQKDSFPIRAVITEKWVPINSIDDLEKASTGVLR